LGIAEFIVPTGSFFHAQILVSFHIIEELSPNVRKNPWLSIKDEVNGITWPGILCVWYDLVDGEIHVKRTFI